MEHYDAYELRLSQPCKPSIAPTNFAGFDNSLGNLSIDWESRACTGRTKMDPSVPEFWFIGSAINLALRIMEQDKSVESLAEIGLTFLDILGRGFPTAYTGGYTRLRMRLHVALFLQRMRANFVNVQVTSRIEDDAQAVLSDLGTSSTEYDTKDGGVLRLNAKLVRTMIRAAKSATEKGSGRACDMARYRTYQFQLAAVIARHMCYFFLGSVSGTGCHSLLNPTQNTWTTGGDLGQVWEQMVFGGDLQFRRRMTGQGKECKVYITLQDSTTHLVDPKAVDKIVGHQLSRTLPLRTVGREMSPAQDFQRLKFGTQKTRSSVQGPVRLATSAVIDAAKGQPRYSIRDEDFRTLIRVARYPELVPML